MATATPQPSLDQLKALQKQAFENISLGLDLDQVDAISALGFYTKGVNLLRQAVRIPYSSDEAKMLQEKMQKNLREVEERIQTIEYKMGGNSRGDPIIIHPQGFNIGSTQFIPSQPVYAPFSHSTLPPTLHSVPPARQTSIHPPNVSIHKPNQNNNHARAVQPPQHHQQPHHHQQQQQQNNGRVVQPQNQQNAESEKSKRQKESFEKLKQMDPKIRDIILNEIVMDNPGVSWDEVAGLEGAKQALREAAVLPILRPDIFSGLRTPARGILMFGPPGNGKTFLARCVASECNANFFSISASSLTSKWVGDSEKLVRCLFAAAKNLQPSIIFIDEIDSVLGERGGSNEHEASRRLKTEFLVQFDGVNSSSDDQILFIGATNRPQDLDEAVRRRLVKRIYIPLPEKQTRLKLIQNLLAREKNINIQQKQLNRIVELTEGYSGSDLAALCRDAALEPVREQGIGIKDIPLDRLRPISFNDFEKAIKRIRPSVSQQNIRQFEEWNEQFGSN